MKTILTAGFAIFSMFFGSGNLVFPLIVGTQVGDSMGYAMLGLLLTGVVVPFLGLLGVMLYAGDRSKFFESSIGKRPAFFLIFLLLAMLGPLGIVPRSIMVAYGGMAVMMPNLSFPLFSALFCLVILALAWNPNKIVPILGRILGPIFLVGIIIITIGGLVFSESLACLGKLSSTESFKMGLFGGYQTMDLLTAFFFAATTLNYLKAHEKDPKKLLKSSLIASALGAGCVGLIYISFVALGAKHGECLSQVNSEQIFATIAGNVLGPIAIPLVAFTIVLACLTTGAVLGMLFADFVHKDISQCKFGQKKSIVLMLIISFLVSLIGFDSLRVCIECVLKVAYPALIVLTLSNIVCKIWKIPHFGRWGFWLTTFMSTAFYIINN